MSIYLVLDLLLILLIVLFAPIGYWRGPVKELLVTFGVLFGILLADFWARPWGRDLSDITAIGSNGGAFIVAMAFLVTVTFVLGYGAGAALAPWDFSPRARILGAGIALFNGILLVAFSLQYVRVYLLSPSTEESLYDSYVVQFLLDQIGWVLLAVALVAWPVLLVILITGRRAYEFTDDYGDYGYGPVDDVEYDDAEYYEEDAREVVYQRQAAVADPRPFPPRVPVAQPVDEESSRLYKAEPAVGSTRPTDATRPIRVREDVQSPEAARPVEADVAFDAGGTDPDMTIVSAPTPARPANDDLPGADAADDEPSDLAPGYTRCVNCHAVLPPNTRVCPVCGEVN